ncbi:tectonic-like complex member MKS1, partial [Oppia nitens]|uniref:tectonic-like complex member MKS1 n=1 Tax=Oppia nitens TaxID=1686743 RepID=UPI0023DB08A8
MSSNETINGHNVLLINGTIELAKGFNCSHSCVCFYIESNKDWSFVNNLNESSLYWTTHKCRTNGSDVSLFSTPFQIEIKFTEIQSIDDLRPILYMKVLSFDYWNRLIGESFGFAELPVKPGRHNLVVSTWKPYIGDRVQRLKEFFIGCTPVVNNLHKDFTNKLNRCTNNYGLESQSSGSLVVDIDVVIQNQSPKVMTKDKYHIKSSSSLDSLKHNILSVVLAFQRAKRRMDSIRSELND